MKSLTRLEAEETVTRIINGDLTQDQIGELLLALRHKNETAEELLGFVDGILKHAHFIEFSEEQKPDVLLDVCGTGGDGAGTFNVSTAVALVLASLQVKVAKHGNRGVSSRSGSSDVLEMLGIGSDTSPQQAIESLRNYNLSFLFAPSFHPVLARLAAIRKSLGVYTIFNALGPLLNPAPITHQMVGVYHKNLLMKVATVLKNKGIKQAYVVHGSDGLDEFTLSGPTDVAQLKDDVISEFKLTPEDFGLSSATLEQVRGGTPEENAKILINIFNGEKSHKRDLVLMNAAAALVLVGKSSDFKAAALLAASAIDSGKTMRLLNQMKNERNHSPGGTA